MPYGDASSAGVDTRPRSVPAERFDREIMP